MKLESSLSEVARASRPLCRGHPFTALRAGSGRAAWHMIFRLHLLPSQAVRAFFVRERELPPRRARRPRYHLSPPVVHPVGRAANCRTRIGKRNRGAEKHENPGRTNGIVVWPYVSSFSSRFLCASLFSSFTRQKPYSTWIFPDPVRRSMATPPPPTLPRSSPRRMVP